MSKLSDQQILELFRNYEDSIVDNFKKYAKDRGYDATNLDLEGFWHEGFSLMDDRDFFEMVVDNMENSIGPEEYGLINEEDDD